MSDLIVRLLNFDRSVLRKQSADETELQTDFDSPKKVEEQDEGDEMDDITDS